MSKEEVNSFHLKMVEKYDGEAHPFYCGARLLNDRILKFHEIRDWLSAGFEICLQKPIPEPNFGNFRF